MTPSKLRALMLLFLAAQAHNAFARNGAITALPNQCFNQSIDDLGFIKTFTYTQSVQQMLMPQPNGTDYACSFFWTSKQGYALTAGHCLSDCVLSQLMEQQDLEKVTDPSFRATLMADHLIGKPLFPIGCVAVIDGVYQPVQVLAYESCQKANGAPHGEDKNCTDNLDYALIQPLTTQKSPACLKLSAETPAVGDVTSIVGFPSRTYSRPHNENSDGVSEYITYGKATDQTSCQFGRGGGKSGVHYQTWKDSFNDDGLLKLTNDGMPGDSGGAVLNSKNEAVGIVIGGSVDNNAYETCPGSVFATPVASIIQSIHSHFPAVDMHAAFNCN